MGEGDDNMEELVKKLCTMEVPLNERLAIFSGFVRKNAPEFADAYDDLAARLRSAASGSVAPGAGDVMPDFALPDSALRIHRLDEMLERGPVVVSFNRGHWCPYCTVELHAFKQAMQEIAATGAQVVSIMPDKREFVGRIADEVGHSFTVLSDENNGYALSLGLVIWLGNRIRQLNEAIEIQLETSQGNDGWVVPIPATFVVGADGRVIARTVDPDFRKRMDIEDIIAAVKRAWS